MKTIEEVYLTAVKGTTLVVNTQEIHDFDGGVMKSGVRARKSGDNLENGVQGYKWIVESPNDAFWIFGNGLKLVEKTLEGFKDSEDTLPYRNAVFIYPDGTSEPIIIDVKETNKTIRQYEMTFVGWRASDVIRSLEKVQTKHTL